MQLTVLGCNGLYPSNGNNASGYLLTCDNLSILLDVGSGVFASLKKVIAPEKIDVIFLSHLHHDHVSDIGVYNYYLEKLAKQGVDFKKPKLLVKNDESAVYRLIEGLNYFEIVNYGEKFKIQDISFEFFSRPHPVLTHGVTVISDNKKFSYASDGAMDERLSEAIKGSDLTLCHAPFSLEKAKTNKAHASAFEVVLLAKNFNRKVLISHLNPDCDNMEIKRECEFAKGNYEFVSQNQLYSI